MGAQDKRKMQSTVVLASLAVIFANASPISDSVVPEDTDFAMDTDLSEARATINDMIADGASDADCRKLTGDTINDIKSSVEILQKEIDAVSSGVECNTEGQTQVKITAEAQTKAHTTLTTSKKELTKCTEAKVDFGSRVYSTLTVGKCDTFFSHGAYVTAKASFQTATKAFQLATGAHTQAVTEAKMAVETAKKLRHQCLCKKKKEHETVYSVRHASAAANLKAWVKAHQIICVLDDKKSCRIPAVPTVTRGKIYSDAKEAKCSTPTPRRL